MKKIFILVLLLLIGLPGFCGDTYWYPGKHTVFLHNKNLALFNKTYNHYKLEYYGCFAYTNVEKAKLNGKVFASETACLRLDYANYEISVEDVFFHFKDIKNPTHVPGKAYYFKNQQILREAIIALMVADDGWLNE